MAKNTKLKTPNVAAGDFVLCGGTRASYPGEWYLGQVLWAGKGDALLERATQNGRTWREVIAVVEIRAVGTIEQLVTVQDEARKACAELTRAIHECTSELGRARDALFAKLDALAEGGLKVVPPDFEAIEDHGVALQATVEQADVEAASLREGMLP